MIIFCSSTSTEELSLLLPKIRGEDVTFPGRYCLSILKTVSIGFASFWRLKTTGLGYDKKNTQACKYNPNVFSFPLKLTVILDNHITMKSVYFEWLFASDKQFWSCEAKWFFIHIICMCLQFFLSLLHLHVFMKLLHSEQFFCVCGILALSLIWHA